MFPMRGMASDFYELSIPGVGEGILLLYLYLPLPICLPCSGRRGVGCLCVWRALWYKKLGYRVLPECTPSARRPRREAHRLAKTVVGTLVLFASIAHLVSHVYLMKAMDVIGVHLMLESLALHDAGESSATSAWF